MRFVEVDRIPEKRERFPYKNLRSVLDEFMNMNIKLAMVDSIENDYKNANVAYSVLRNAVERYGYPIKVYLHDGSVYLKRRDI